MKPANLLQYQPRRPELTLGHDAEIGEGQADHQQAGPIWLAYPGGKTLARGVELKCRLERQTRRQIQARRRSVTP